MIFKGFKFGMLLQLAIGPVCVFIFQEGCNRGFFSAEAGVAGVALVDALYILLAILGIAKFLGDPRTQKIFMIIGAAIVGIFGLNIVAETFGFPLIPNLNLLCGITSGSAFWTGSILTASNPLTILFWAGVFSAKVAEEQMQRKDIYLFGLGAVAATLAFLTVIAIAGNFTQRFLPGRIIGILNFGVGWVLVFLGVKMALKLKSKKV